MRKQPRQLGTAVVIFTDHATQRLLYIAGADDPEAAWTALRGRWSDAEIGAVFWLAQATQAHQLAAAVAMAMPVASRTAAIVLREGTVAEASELIEKIAKERGFQVSAEREVAAEDARVAKLEDAKQIIARAQSAGEMYRFNQSYKARRLAGEDLPNHSAVMTRLAERVAEGRDAPPFNEITLASILAEVAGMAQQTRRPPERPPRRRQRSG
jgi:hypothetical protein